MCGRTRREGKIMSATSPTRRDFLAFTAATGAAGLLPGALAAAGDAGAMRPFRIAVPDAQLVDLRRRIAATRWPDRETVPDRAQGVRLEKLQALVRHWGTGHDWRKAEAKLNALPHV